MSTPTPAATSTGYQPSTQQVKVGSSIAWVNTDGAIYNTQLFGPTS
jgi:plastocyanin